MKDFKCTSSWIQRFKTRHSISFASIRGEAGKVDRIETDSWLENQWPVIKSGYQDKDIFKGDETGLFYKLPPNKTLKFKGERCFGGKLSK